MINPTEKTMKPSEHRDHVRGLVHEQACRVADAMSAFAHDCTESNRDTFAAELRALAMIALDEQHAAQSAPPRLTEKPFFEGLAERQRERGDHCSGCGSANCSLLWSGQHKCCPDCSHAPGSPIAPPEPAPGSRESECPHGVGLCTGSCARKPAAPIAEPEAGDALLLLTQILPPYAKGSALHCAIEAAFRQRDEALARVEQLRTDYIKLTESLRGDAARQEVKRLEGELVTETRRHANAELGRSAAWSNSVSLEKERDEALAKVEELRSRLVTIIDEACGLQPVDTSNEELFTLLEKDHHDWRMRASDAANESFRLAELFTAATSRAEAAEALLAEIRAVLVSRCWDAGSVKNEQLPGVVVSLLQSQSNLRTVSSAANERAEAAEGRVEELEAECRALHEPNELAVGQPVITRATKTRATVRALERKVTYVVETYNGFEAHYSRGGVEIDHGCYVCSVGPGKPCEESQSHPRENCAPANPITEHPVVATSEPPRPIVVGSVWAAADSRQQREVVELNAGAVCTLNIPGVKVRAHWSESTFRERHVWVSDPPAPQELDSEGEASRREPVQCTIAHGSGADPQVVFDIADALRELVGEPTIEPLPDVAGPLSAPAKDKP